MYSICSVFLWVYLVNVYVCMYFVLCICVSKDPRENHSAYSPTHCLQRHTHLRTSWIDHASWKCQAFASTSEESPWASHWSPESEWGRVSLSAAAPSRSRLLFPRRRGWSGAAAPPRAPPCVCGPHCCSRGAAACWRARGNWAARRGPGNAAPPRRRRRRPSPASRSSRAKFGSWFRVRGFRIPTCPIFSCALLCTQKKQHQHGSSLKMAFPCKSMSKLWTLSNVTVKVFMAVLWIAEANGSSDLRNIVVVIYRWGCETWKHWQHLGLGELPRSCSVFPTKSMFFFMLFLIG